MKCKLHVFCESESCPRHGHCFSCGISLKETPTAVEKDIEGKCCDLCWNSKLALHPRNEKKRIQSGCGFACFCHIERKVKLPTRNVISAHSKPQPEKDIQENLRLMNHGIIYQQPEKEWWEDELPEAILAALEYRGFYDAGKYLNDTFLEHIRPIIARIAAQSEKKGREARDKLLEDIAYAFSKLNLDNSRHGDCPYQDALIEINDLLERARSSEEGKPL